MAGIVNPASQLIVTGGGSGGGAVTIADGADVAEGSTTDPIYPGSGAGTVVGILKAILAASSSGGLADIQVLPHTTWTPGSPATVTFNTPASGTLYLYLHGTWTGNIAAGEQYDTGGSFASSQGYIIPTTGLSNTHQNWQNWFGQFGTQGTDFVTAITVKGIAFQLTNNLATGSVVITGLFKRNDEGVKPVINMGAVNGFGADVNQFNELTITRVGGNQQWVIPPVNDAISPSSAQIPVDGIISYLFNGSTYDRARGDATNGAYVNLKASIRVGTDTEYVGLGTEKLVQAVQGLQFDNVSAPVVGEGGPYVGSVVLMVNPGLGYDRLPGDVTNGAWVNVKNSVPIGITASSPIPTKLSVPSSAFGTISSAGPTLLIDVTGAATVVVTCSTSSGGITGSITFEASTDTVNWQSIYGRVKLGYNAAIDGSMIKFFDPNQVIPEATVFVVPVAGFQQFRLNATFWLGGSIGLVVISSPAAGLQDSIVTLAGQPIKTTITDSLNNSAQVAPAFSAAFSSNPALVVALSPNTPVNINSLPLPPNAAIETGGNLALQVAYLFDLIVPLLTDIRTELRIHNEYARNGFNLDDESESMRRDPAFTS